MSLPWISVNKRLLEAVEIINSVSLEKFKQILIGEVKEEDQSELKLSNSDAQLLIHGTDHLLKKSAKIIVKPTVLQKNLTEVLKMHQDKSEEFVRVWTERAKLEFGDLDERKKLDDVLWQLNVETNSSCQEEGIEAKGRLQLFMSDLSGGGQEQCTLEMREEDLLNLYNILEAVQNKLDSVQGAIK